MSEAKIDIETRLNAPELDEAHGLQTVLRSTLGQHTTLRPAHRQEARAYWPAAHFKLDQASLFCASSADEQTEILRHCSQNVLAESYYIEKSGMYFAAKMGLLAESAQERLLYSLFGAEEAVHFSWVKNFVADDAIAEYIDNSFIRLLDGLLQREDRKTLVVVIQVLLEGWGLHHYTALARDCLDEELRSVFMAILKDEARHHASGLISANEESLSRGDVQHLADRLTPLFRMVQSGPQMIVYAIERVKGHLSAEQKQRTFAELDCQRESAKQLALLQSFLRATKSGEPLIDSLQKADALRSLSPEECATA